MPHYRIYIVTDDGHVAGPPHVIQCADDQEAMGKAVQYTNGKAVELWDGARFIVRFPSDEGKFSADPATCDMRRAASPSTGSRLVVLGVVVANRSGDHSQGPP